MKKVNKKIKMAKNLTLPHWDLNPGVLNKTFPPKIWILSKIRSIELTVLKKSGLYLARILKLTLVVYSFPASVFSGYSPAAPNQAKCLLISYFWLPHFVPLILHFAFLISYFSETVVKLPRFVVLLSQPKDSNKK